MLTFRDFVVEMARREAMIQEAERERWIRSLLRASGPRRSIGMRLRLCLGRRLIVWGWALIRRYDRQTFTIGPGLRGERPGKAA